MKDRIFQLLSRGVPGADRARNRRSELEFLPAALEIQETPPLPFGRTILWTIIAFFAIALAWAAFGNVEIVAVAHGKVIPSGRVKVIQPLEIGVVRAIHVTEGQHVQAGELLVELDPTASEADHERLQREFLAARLEHVRLEILAQITEPADRNPQDEEKRVFPDVEGASSEAIAIQQSMLHAQWAEYRARGQTFDSAIASHQAELAAIQENIKKFEATLPLITRRSRGLKKLVGKQLASENTWLEMEEERIEQKQDLAALKNRVEQVNASIEETRLQKAVAAAEFQRSLFTELATAEQRIGALEQELIKARQKTILRRLTAPISGVIQQLTVHTIGGVVTPAQELMRVVPRENKLEVEAWIQNRDIGFVRKGDAAAVKVEAFPFTKYGMIQGAIDELSSDAVSDEKLGLIYAAQVSLQDAFIKVEDKHVNLSPGMAVTAEVKTGERKIIEYLLSPLLRYKQESIRER